MSIRDWLFIVLALSLGAGWLVDRTKQFDAGKASCAQEIQKAQADYEQRQKKEDQKKIEAADKAATKATEHINSLETEKTKAVEHTRVIIKTIPAECSKPTDSFVRDYNEALNSLQTSKR